MKVITAKATTDAEAAADIAANAKDVAAKAAADADAATFNAKAAAIKAAATRTFTSGSTKANVPMAIATKSSVPTNEKSNRPTSNRHKNPPPLPTTKSSITNTSSINAEKKLLPFPIIDNWINLDNNCIDGYLSGSQKYPDGTPYKTSTIIGKSGRVITTKHGSRYMLGKRSSASSHQTNLDFTKRPNTNKYMK